MTAYDRAMLRDHETWVKRLVSAGMTVHIERPGRLPICMRTVLGRKLYQVCHGERIAMESPDIDQIAKTFCEAVGWAL